MIGAIVSGMSSSKMGNSWVAEKKTLEMPSTV